MTVLARTALVLCAFLPVFPLVAVRVWETNRTLSVLLVLVALVIAVVAWVTLRLLARGAVRRVTVQTADSHAESLVGFIFSYLVPPTLIDGRDTYVVAVNGVAFALLVAVAVRSQLVFLNPLLSLLGQHVFTVDVKATDKAPVESLVILVNRPDIAKGTRLEVRGSTGPLQRARVIV